MNPTVKVCVLLLMLNVMQNASVVLNKLFKMTALQTSFHNIVLVHGRPKMLNLKRFD